MEFAFINAPKIDNSKVEDLVNFFVVANNIPVLDYKIVLDFRPNPENRCKHEGIFGGFKALLDDKTITVDLLSFIEYKKGNSENVAHCIFHELIHVRDLLRGDLKISRDGKALTYKTKTYERCPFSFDLFAKMQKYDKKLAQEYNIHSLPWEKEAYTIPSEFMGREIFNY